MIKDKTILGIISARGGSKRLPRKNIMPMAGKPLISWTIEAACKSKYIDKVIVTSDNDEILSISSQWGAGIIKRPDELASDTATSFDAVKHAIDNNTKYDYVILLQPTSPLRTAGHIDEAVELLELKKADAIISVCEAEHNPDWCNIIPDDGQMDHFLKKDKKIKDHSKYYRLNGAIYICATDRLLEEKTFFIRDNIYAYYMDRESSVDIDTYFDFRISEFLIKQSL